MSYIESFVKKLELDNKSKKTIRYYIDDARQFEKYIIDKNNKNSIDYKNLTLGDIEDFLYNIKKYGGRNNAAASIETINRKIASLKKYIGFLYMRDIIEKDISKSIEKVRTREKKQINTLTLEEIKLLKQAPNKSNLYHKEIEFQRSRDNLILYLFLNTGLRDEELRSLTIDNIDFNTCILDIKKAKMNQTRAFYIDEEGIKLFKEYIYYRSIKNNIKDNESLFVSIRGCKLNHTSCTRSILKKLLEVSGIDKDRIDCISQHKLRHTFATMSFRSGNTLNNISRQLGHKTEATTRNIYIHESPEDIVDRRISLNY